MFSGCGTSLGQSSLLATCGAFQDWDTNDLSMNNWLVGILAFGEDVLQARLEMVAGGCHVVHSKVAECVGCRLGFVEV